MMKVILLLLALMTLPAMSATGPKAAYSMSQEGKAVIVDVREKDEIESGMIKGALWFPLSKIENDKNWKKDFLKATKGKTVFVHCRSGKRSEKVKNILKEEGFKAENIGGYETLKEVLPVTVPSKEKK